MSSSNPNDPRLRRDMEYIRQEMVATRDRRGGEGRARLEEGILENNLAQADQNIIRTVAPEPLEVTSPAQPVQGEVDLETDAFAQSIMNRGKEN